MVVMHIICNFCFELYAETWKLLLKERLNPNDNRHNNSMYYYYRDNDRPTSNFISYYSSSCILIIITIPN